MRERVIIENVKPQIDGGRYPIKRIVGEQIKISADIFADGHEAIRAAVLYKALSAKTWNELPLLELPNDTFETEFSIETQGVYEYKVIAWVDHLQYWYNGFLKKEAVGQYLSVELEEGVVILEKAAKTFPKSKAKELLSAAKNLKDNNNYKGAIALVLSEEFKQLVADFPFKQFVTENDQLLKIKVERQKALFSSWYEFFPRSASSQAGVHGTFKDAAAQIPRVAEMGFDILYFPPIHPVGEINRKGKNNSTTAEPGEAGSPWAIGSKDGGHKSVNPQLGTMEDYENLINTAKDHNIEIALDLAYQCAPDHPYVTTNPEWFVWRPDNTIMYAENPPKKYQDIVPMDFECDAWESLWEELKSIIVFWIKKGINVFRVDNPHTKSFNFWEWCIGAINKEYPDVIFLAEAFTRPKPMASLAKKGFTQGYTYFTWRSNKQELQEYMQYLTQTESREVYRPNFWPNTPDILPFHLQDAGENMFAMRLLLAATLSSNYGVYGPAYEFMDNNKIANGKEEYLNSEKFEIKTYNWNARNRMTSLMTKVNKIRKENPAFQSTFNIRFTNTNSDHIMSFIKVDNNGGVIWCVVNLDPENTQRAFVNVPRELLDMHGHVNLRMHDLLTDQYFEWKNDWNYVELNPYYYPMHILRIE
ncbi:MAG: starch synthase (maltosyl-transferring) [Saprospiraceae bacterium]|jgi:starch synthase (maltosyl-transferring)